MRYQLAFQHIILLVYLSHVWNFNTQSSHALTLHCAFELSKKIIVFLSLALHGGVRDDINTRHFLSVFMRLSITVAPCVMGMDDHEVPTIVMSSKLKTMK